MTDEAKALQFYAVAITSLLMIGFLVGRCTA